VLAGRRARGGASVDLIVKAGRPLRIALDERVEVKRPGQPDVGTVVAPVYVYDRIVVRQASADADAPQPIQHRQEDEQNGPTSRDLHTPPALTRQPLSIGQSGCPSF
jgi:hypothetical protein